jgi:hypothetical protein
MKVPVPNPVAMVVIVKPIGSDGTMALGIL